jgi:hypothetical protein
MHVELQIQTQFKLFNNSNSKGGRFEKVFLLDIQIRAEGDV